MSRPVHVGLFILLLCSAVMFSGCEQLADLIPETQESATQDQSDAQEDSMAAVTLEGLLDDLDYQVDLILDAKAAGDASSVKSLFDEFVSMDGQFFAELEDSGGELSSAESTALARRHRDIVKRL